MGVEVLDACTVYTYIHYSCMYLDGLWDDVGPLTQNGGEDRLRVWAEDEWMELERGGREGRNEGGERYLTGARTHVQKTSTIPSPTSIISRQQGGQQGYRVCPVCPRGNPSPKNPSIPLFP